MVRKSILVSIAAGAVLIAGLSNAADARGFRSGRHYYGGGHHTSSHGGRFISGRGSSHKGGHYSHPTHGRRYGRHR